ncbi:hypothetical protein LQV05_005096 [Cryptococcus neoformans]|nr:hypothetical protein LQV05_005096 [Cryptococcus neoformans]
MAPGVDHVDDENFVINLLSLHNPHLIRETADWVRPCYLTFRSQCTQRKRLTENASKLGRSWLSTIPLFQPLRLSDIDIASALYDRTLAMTNYARGRNPWSQRRHDTINRAIYQHLNQVNGAIIEIEPPTISGQRRNDLRIRGTSSLPCTDYDLKVLSLGDNDARSTAVPHPPNSKLADFYFDRCVGWLDKVGKAVERRAPRFAGGVFKPLILSTGGLTSHGTADELKAWREAMPEGVFVRLQRRISIELVKARARTLVL